MAPSHDSDPFVYLRRNAVGRKSSDVTGVVAPLWVPRGDNGRPATMVRDHVNARFFFGGSVQADVSAFNAAASRTFSRSSSKTRRNAAGVVENVGINVEALDWSAAGAPLGLSLDDARTNTLLNSAILATQSVNVTAAGTYTLSFYGTGTVTLSGVSTEGPLVGTGENTRVSLTFTPTANGALTLTVSGSVNMANLEVGVAPSSWIPTASAATTRAADLDTHNDAANSRPFSGFAQGKGALIWEGDAQPVTCGLVTLTDGTYSNRIELGQSGSNIALLMAHLGVIQANIGSSVSSVARTRALALWDTNRVELWINGSKIGATDTSATIPTVTKLFVGRNGASLFGMFGHSGNIAYFDEPPWSRAAALSTIGGV